VNTYVATPATSPDVRRMYDHDVEQVGFVLNLSGVWGHQPALHAGLFDLIGQAVEAGTLSFRQRGILITAMASTLGDSYCSLAWGNRLSDVAGGELAGAVLRGADEGLDARERALAGWARRLADDPGATVAADVQPLRDNGYDDAQIVAITVFVALRMAFSVVNGALGAHPDRELAETAEPEVRAAVTYGRAVS
jgi:alkylhydroperoxidase family enzyme